MESITDKVQSDEQPPPAPTIPQLVERIKGALVKLLRLVRPAEAGPIRETVDDLAAAFGELLEQILRQAHLQSAEAVTLVLRRLDELEARIAERERVIGGDE